MEWGAGQAVWQQAVPTGHWSCQIGCYFGGCSVATRGIAVQGTALSHVGTQSLLLKPLFLTSSFIIFGCPWGSSLLSAVHTHSAVTSWPPCPHLLPLTATQPQPFHKPHFPSRRLSTHLPPVQPHSQMSKTCIPHPTRPCIALDQLLTPFPLPASSPLWEVFSLGISQNARCVCMSTLQPTSLPCPRCRCFPRGLKLSIFVPSAQPGFLSGYSSCVFKLPSLWPV